MCARAFVPPRAFARAFGLARSCPALAGSLVLSERAIETGLFNVILVVSSYISELTGPALVPSDAQVTAAFY